MPTQRIVLILGMVFLITPPSIAAQFEQGKAVYLDYGCAVCHGPNVDGKGLSVQKSDPPPTNLTKKSDYRFGSSREQVRLSIINGIKEENSIMPPFKHIQGQELDDLLNYLLAIQEGNVVGKSVTFLDVWVRLLPPSSTNTAGFFEVNNQSTEDIVIVGASVKEFDRIELHEMKTIDGMMRMRQVKQIVIKANSTFSLEEQGYHLMLMGKKRPLIDGEILDIELLLDNGHKELIKAVVKKDE